MNRVFVLSFPSAEARTRFFADERYRAVRADLFEPAVAVATELGLLVERDVAPRAPPLRSPA